MNTQKQLVDFLAAHPMKTEKQICMELWGSKRGKKHADLIRRALHNKKVTRVKFKVPNSIGRGLLCYYVPNKITKPIQVFLNYN
jgi:hypothetical protein